MVRYFKDRANLDAFHFNVDAEPDWFIKARKNGLVRVINSYGSFYRTEVNCLGVFVPIDNTYCVINSKFCLDVVKADELCKENCINNVPAIVDLLEFRSTDDYYEIAIIDRPKDKIDPDNNRTTVLKKYMVSSVESLGNVLPEIRKICDAFNCRAYIYLNTRSHKATSFEQIQKALTCIKDSYYKGVKNSFNLTKSTSKARKVFILDYDNEVNAMEFDEVVKSISEFTTVYGIVNTPNGKHIIMKPFDKRVIKDELLKKYEIKSDSPTLLYCNIEKA